MNHQMISMLEDIKTGTYTSYTNYLDEVTVNQILHWFTQFALGDTNETESIISLIYELYIREDIDLRPYEEYVKVVSYLAEKYNFDKSKFLYLYQKFRQMIFGN